MSLNDNVALCLASIPFRPNTIEAWSICFFNSSFARRKPETKHWIVWIVFPESKTSSASPIASQCKQINWPLNSIWYRHLGRVTFQIILHSQLYCFDLFVCLISSPQSLQANSFFYIQFLFRLVLRFNNRFFGSRHCRRG